MFQLRAHRTHASAHRVSSFQGPLLLAFEEDPLQQPLELAVRRVSSMTSSAQDKVSRLSPEASLSLPRGARSEPVGELILSQKYGKCRSVH